jgi:membrane associated rhomboid family serine protease
VDCVREQSRGIRTPRTIFGGRVGASRPVVTQTIIGLCVLAYLGQWFGGGQVTGDLSFVPYEAVAQPYRFLTSAFLHAPNFVLHIVMNMYALWILGPYLERLLGRLRFVLLYLVSAIGGSVGYFVLAAPSVEPGATWSTPAVGASGAIFGLFSALVIVNRRLGRDVSGIVGVILINVVLGFWPGLGIAWQAHLGGLVTGAALAWVLVAGSDRQRRDGLHTAGLTAVCAALALACLVKVMTVPTGLLL